MARNFQKRAKRANKPNPREDRRADPRNKVIPFVNEADIDARFSRKPKKKIEILPRSLAQEEYVDALFDESRHIVFAMGPAGCGKTFLAALYAVQGLQNGDFEKIVVTRPAVSVDEQHGFLPGSISEKMSPWLAAILDVMKEHYSPQQVDKMIEDEIIDIAPLAYMRGRTFKNAIILADEMQNATVSQMKMVLTRIGENSKMIVTGDLAQHDRGFEQNGLKDFVERLEKRGSEAMSVCRFGRPDVERHPVIEDILKIYGDE